MSMGSNQNFPTWVGDELWSNPALDDKTKSKPLTFKDVVVVSLFVLALVITSPLWLSLSAIEWFFITLFW